MVVESAIKSRHDGLTIPVPSTLTVHWKKQLSRWYTQSFIRNFERTDSGKTGAASSLTSLSYEKEAFVSFPVSSTLEARESTYVIQTNAVSLSTGTSVRYSIARI